MSDNTTGTTEGDVEAEVIARGVELLRSRKAAGESLFTVKKMSDALRADPDPDVSAYINSLGEDGLSSSNLWTRICREFDPNSFGGGGDKSRAKKDRTGRHAKKKPKQGQPFDLQEIEPWHDPVGGATLLNDMVKAIKTYVVLAADQALVIALWIIGAHVICSSAFNGWMIFSRLFISAPSMNCGKTTLLDVISELIPRRFVVSGTTPAALFRVIDLYKPVVIIDEADVCVANSEDIRGIIDAGHKRDKFVTRCVGDDYEPRRFNVFAPMALAAIGNLQDTLESRSIKIVMQRKLEDDFVESLRQNKKNLHLEEVARKTARWVADNISSLGNAEPEIPKGISNRTADNWSPLFEIADLIGDDWPEKVRKVATEMVIDRNRDQPENILLLSDLREIFLDVEPDGVLFTEEIIDELVYRDDRDWSAYNKRNNKPISDRQIAALLKTFNLGIKSNTVRRGSHTRKGYRKSDFKEAFERYLPPLTAEDEDEIKKAAEPTSDQLKTNEFDWEGVEITGGPSS